MEVIRRTAIEDLRNGTRQYNFVRIPGILALEDGTLLAYYECRQGADWSAIDIGMRRSTDGGVTWGEREILVSGKGRNTVNNPVMVADGETVHFFYCENYKRLFYTKSRDCGVHWEKPTELTEAVDTQMHGRFWSVLAAGPGHGICLPDGRLLVPLWFAYNREDIFAHHPSEIAVLSGTAEGGWHVSAAIGADVLKNPSECCIARHSGKILLNIRNENACKCRAVAESTDGVQWSTPQMAEMLPDPVCCGGMCSDGETLLFSNCASRTARENLTVRKISADQTVFESLRISADGGYSDICIHRQTQTAFVLFEQAEYQTLQLVQLRTE